MFVNNIFFLDTNHLYCKVKLVNDFKLKKMIKFNFSDVKPVRPFFYKNGELVKNERAANFDANDKRYLFSIKMKKLSLI